MTAYNYEVLWGRREGKVIVFYLLVVAFFVCLFVFSVCGKRNTMLLFVAG